MDKLFFTLLESDEDTPVIDLHHSKNITEAIEQLNHELFGFYKHKIKYCKVIYGIGSGALKKAVTSELAKNPLIKEFQNSEDGGSSIVEL